LNKVAGILDIPLIVTEHATKVLGRTFPELAETFPKQHIKLFEKTKFSMMTEEVNSHLS
jgi:hypothetical protein